MSAALGTLPGWRGPLAHRIASPHAQAAPIALILLNAAIIPPAISVEQWWRSRG
ncbi:MAG: hypothetical protein ACKVQT_11680 [Burkholderiales bacterium]